MIENELYTSSNVSVIGTYFCADNIKNIIFTWRLSGRWQRTNKGLKYLAKQYSQLSSSDRKMYKFTFIGSSVNDEKIIIQKFAKLEGLVSRGKSLQFLQEADSGRLVLADGTASTITGKIFEYLAQQKRALAIVEHPYIGKLIGYANVGRNIVSSLNIHLGDELSRLFNVKLDYSNVNTYNGKNLAINYLKAIK